MIKVQSDAAETTFMLQESKKVLSRPRLWLRFERTGPALHIRTLSPMKRSVIWPRKLPPLNLKSAGALGWLCDGRSDQSQVARMSFKLSGRLQLFALGIDMT